MDKPNFKFACPYCGQHLEAESNWVGMEVECPTCGKAITVPDPPPPTPVITVVERPRLPPVSGTTSSNGSNPNWRKTIPKWAYGAVGAMVVVIIGLSVALSMAKGRTSAAREHSTYAGSSTTSSDDGKKLVPNGMSENNLNSLGKAGKEAEVLFQDAMRYYEGDGVLKNIDKAIRMLKEASEKGSANANAKLALFYWMGLPDDGKSVKKAVEYAEKSGSRKTDLAEMVLGNCYLYGGDEVKQDFSKAYSHFAKKTDYNYSKFMRGLMQYHGVGTEENKEQAAESFFDCCKGKNGGRYCGEAAICLGYMYASGEGIGKDSVEARKWLTWGVKAAGYYVENYRPVYDLLYEKIGLKVGTLDFAKYPANMKLVRYGLLCFYTDFYGK